MKLTNEKEVTRIIIDLINKLHPVKTPRIDLNIQIGRASCRERV